MKIVTLCGSPGLASANRAALRHATNHLHAKRPAIICVDASMEAIPIFDPRRADDPPAATRALSETLATADGIMIAAPEYAGGLAGGTKTVLDWMVGLSSLYHQRIAVMSVASTGGVHALDQLIRTFSMVGRVVSPLGIDVDRFGDLR